MRPPRLPLRVDHSLIYLLFVVVKDYERTRMLKEIQYSFHLNGLINSRHDFKILYTKAAKEVKEKACWSARSKICLNHLKLALFLYQEFVSPFRRVFSPSFPPAPKIIGLLCALGRHGLHILLETEKLTVRLAD